MQTSFLFFLGILLFLPEGELFAGGRNRYELPFEKPGEYSEYHKTIYGVDPLTGDLFTDPATGKPRDIPSYLEGAYCGGWIAKEEEEVKGIYKDDDPKGKIAKVFSEPIALSGSTPLAEIDVGTDSAGNPYKDAEWGVPGRKGDWDASIPSGMAARQSFKYPHGAEGLSFAVEPRNPWCRDDFYFKYQEVPKDPGDLCQTSDQCKAARPWVNTWQYPVFANTLCWNTVSSFCWAEWVFIPGIGWIVVDDGSTGGGCGDQGLCWYYTIDCWDRNWTCNSCTGNNASPWYEFSGMKYACTADGDESDPESEWNTLLLRRPYGWAWDTLEKTDPNYPPDGPDYGPGAVPADGQGTLWDQPQYPVLADVDFLPYIEDNTVLGFPCQPNPTPNDPCFGCGNYNYMCPWVRGFPAYKPAAFPDTLWQGLGTCSFCSSISTVRNQNAFGLDIVAGGTAINPNTGGAAGAGTGAALSVGVGTVGSTPVVAEITEYPNIITCGREDERGVPGRPQCAANAANYRSTKESPIAPEKKTEGEECRCGAPDVSGNPPPPGCRSTYRTEPLNQVPYESYYRKYNVKWARASTKDDVRACPSEEEGVCKEGRIGCYGWYREFDTASRQTGGQDLRCSVDLNVTDLLGVNMRKGQYGRNSNLPDPNPVDPKEQRDKGAFDISEDLWYRRLGGAFSLLSEKVFHERYAKDLSMALMNPDKATLTGSYQLTKDYPIAKSNFLRSFDDTGLPRTIVKWWQGEETKVDTIMSPPKVRLLLPAAWAIGIDPLDPLFTPPQDPADVSKGRTGTIEVQIHAKEDIAGEVSAFIERSLLLDVEEAPVTVTVPLASRADLTSLKERWCAYVMEIEKKPDCTNPSTPKVKEYMDRLEAYAQRIEDVRLLRSALAFSLGELLKTQNKLTLPIAQWMNENLKKYKEFLSAREQVELLRPTWEFIGTSYWNFHDKTNFPWCMNQRFTTPTYSLLDPWLPIRAQGGSIEEPAQCATSANPGPECLPRLSFDPDAFKDAVFDLSALKLATGALITIPVLRPIQLRMDGMLRVPGEPINAIPPPLEVVDIEGIVSAVIAEASNLPGVSVKGQPRILVPPPTLNGAKINEYLGIMGQLSTLIQGMDKTYGTFWESLEWNPNLYCPGWSKGKCTGDPKMACKDDKVCEEAGVGTCVLCVHVEMDLLERMTRVGSRPAILLTDDYKSINENVPDPIPGDFTLRKDAAGKVDPKKCPPEDHVCRILLKEETEPKEGWQTRNETKLPERLENLRSTVRKKMLPQPFGDLSSSDAAPSDAPLPDTIQPFDIPAAMDLSPPKSSSSSSTGP